MTKLILGCGYLGRRAAAAWLVEGHDVAAVTRSETKAAELRAAGITPIVGDLATKDGLPPLPPAETVLYAVGFDRSPGQSIEQVYVQGLAQVLDALDIAALDKFLFISSTGVYGQTDGQWVDEQSDCRPRRSGGQACLRAEQLLRAHAVGDSAIVLRLAGLYGPGRIPRRAELSKGMALEVPTSGYLNLVHVDDVVRLLLAAEQRTTAPDLFVVSDGSPVSRIEYFRELARLLNAPEPQFKPPSKTQPATDRASGSNKRVSNRRVREHFEFDFHYPSYREGLSAIVREESQPQDHGK